VTPVLHAPAGGKLWFLLGRRSLKARVLRRRPRAGVLLFAGERALVLGGELHAVELPAPLSARGARRLALAPLAGFSYSARNARKLLASALETLTAPVRGLPPDLLLAAFEPQRLALVCGEQLELSAGRWPRVRTPAARARARRQAVTPMPLRALPRAVAELPACDGAAALGWASPAGPLALPAQWRSAKERARVPATLVELTGAPVSAPACITFERSDAPAPAGKSGVMLRGEGTLAGAGHWREAAIEVSRASWWVGRRTGSSDQR